MNLKQEREAFRFYRGAEHAKDEFFARMQHGDPLGLGLIKFFGILGVVAVPLEYVGKRLEGMSPEEIKKVH